jgi:hypothetical protein
MHDECFVVAVTVRAYSECVSSDVLDLDNSSLNPPRASLAGFFLRFPEAPFCGDGIAGT